MSPTIPILSVLLLSLISGSTEGGQRIDPVPLLRQTLRYWWKIYKTYSEEVTLGYCWAGYLLKIGSELPTNLSASSPAAATRDYSDTIAGATESQGNLFPRGVMASAASWPYGETREGKHPRERRSHARSAVSTFTSDPDGRRAGARRPKRIHRRAGRTANRNVRAAPNNRTGRNSQADGNGRIAPTADRHARRRNFRRRALPVVPELTRKKAPQDGHEFSSRGTSSPAVNPTPNPGDDDEVDFGSTELGEEEDSRRKVLRSLTSHRDSTSAEEDAFATGSFSLEVTRGASLGGQRFPFRRYSSSRKRNSSADGMLPGSWIPRENHGIEEDPAGRRRDPFNNEESSPSRSPFRRGNADAKYPRLSAVKLTDSEGKSSCGPTINSTTPRRETEEVARDSPPRGGSAERAFLGSLGGEGEAAERNALETVSGSDTRMRERSWQPRKEESSRYGRDVSTAMIHPYFPSEFRRQMLRENRGFPSVATIPQKSREDGGFVRIARNAPSLSGHVIGDYEDSAGQSTQRSLIVLQDSRDPNQLSLGQKPTVEYGIRSFVIAVFRTLGMFVQVGRQIIDVVQTNAALDCTRGYLWTKFVKWVDT